MRCAPASCNGCTPALQPTSSGALEQIGRFRRVWAASAARNRSNHHACEIRCWHFRAYSCWAAKTQCQSVAPTGQRRASTTRAQTPTVRQRTMQRQCQQLTRAPRQLPLDAINPMRRAGDVITFPCRGPIAISVFRSRPTTTQPSRAGFYLICMTAARPSANQRRLPTWRYKS